MNKPERIAACQTLFRGLDIISAVSENIKTLPEISEHIKVSLSTTYRLATALVQEGYLNYEAKRGYSLGYKLIELGFLAYSRLDLPAIAKPILEKLREDTSDTIHLAIREGVNVFYLEKLQGNRAVEISSRVGGNKLICMTGIGKAMLLNSTTDDLIKIYQDTLLFSSQEPAYSLNKWLEVMKVYIDGGYAFDLGEDSSLIRCVAAPIYNGVNQIIAAISVSSAMTYMDNERMYELIPVVKKAANEISRQIGAK